MFFEEGNALDMFVRPQRCTQFVLVTLNVDITFVHHKTPQAPLIYLATLGFENKGTLSSAPPWAVPPPLQQSISSSSRGVNICV